MKKNSEEGTRLGGTQCAQGHRADGHCWPAHVRVRANVSPMTLCTLVTIVL